MIATTGCAGEQMEHLLMACRLRRLRQSAGQKSPDLGDVAGDIGKRRSGLHASLARGALRGSLLDGAARNKRA
jgi:hypothetical protein